jgi:hypothetical protein
MNKIWIYRDEYSYKGGITMPEYTGKDHVKTAFRRIFTDRVPSKPR